MGNSGSGGGEVRRRDFLGGIVAALGGGALGAFFHARARADTAALSSRPYLFFGAGDVAALRQKCASTMKPQLDALLRFAATHLGDPVPGALQGDYEGKGDMLQSPFLVSVVNFSFLSVVTDEERYREAGKRWTLGLASLGELVGTFDAEGNCVNCGYPEGWACVALAVAYDWLYPHFTEQERAMVRDRLERVTRALHAATVGHEWWTGAYLHHDTWIPLGGLGLGAMALLDDTTEARGWADCAAHELLASLSLLDSDGAWPEGACGWAFALQSVIPFLDAYRRRLPGSAAALLENVWLSNTWEHRVASRLPTGLFLGFGDCSASGGYQLTAFEGAPALRFLASEYQNPYAQWAAAREWESRPNPYTAVWEIIWADPALGEAPADELRGGVLFENQGLAFLRTGWDVQGTVLAFHCDSLLGRQAASSFRGDRAEQLNNSTTHVHADANSFVLWSRGELATAMAKYGQKETRFHSSLLVDGQGQYLTFGADHPGRPEGVITGFFASRQAGFVAGEAARCYPPGLSSYARRIYLVQPGIMFLIDDLSAERPVDLEWRIRLDDNAVVETSAGGFTSLLYTACTWVRLARPSGARLAALEEVGNHAVTISPGDKKTKAELVAVVLPSLPAEARPIIGTPDERSFVIEALGARVVATFARTPGVLEIQGRLAGHGTAAIVTEREDAEGIFVADSTWLAVKGELVLVASSPVTAAYSREGRSTRLTVEAQGPTVLTLKGVTLSVPAGRSEHEFG